MSLWTAIGSDTKLWLTQSRVEASLKDGVARERGPQMKKKGLVSCELKCRCNTEF